MYFPSDAALPYRIRVLCEENYYNTTCSKFCRPRDDRLGHYTCSGNGDKVCMDGWLGADCDIGTDTSNVNTINELTIHSLDYIASKKTNPSARLDVIPSTALVKHRENAVAGSGGRGSCVTSAFPIRAANTARVATHPGRVTAIPTGEASSVIKVSNLNTCRHRPCENNGLCINHEPDNYTCQCPVGFKGRNCKIADDPCASSPCRNGGTCLYVTNGFVCTCRPGWTGDTCSREIDECESQPCLHGGTCVDLVDGFRCTCEAGWQGPQCQLDMDECAGRPCVHAVSCRDMVGDYTCECQSGWSGKNCDIMT
ncbi:JAG2-like protein [Mya arenaria]|uniref:Delta-like protein n=1 Tax=Mya arenaria TaxID=6604 RepID=A0ABY7FDF6_MYAAR|nr:JAG2-like protein [Mya arenaria]